MTWTQDAKVNSGSPVGPGFVVYERAPGLQGYDLDMARRSVGPGWRRLLEVFWAMMERNRDVADWRDVAVVQVKEKFGTLRLYITGGTDRSYSVVDGIELASEAICEACGAPGRLRSETRSWILTLCDGCDALPSQALRARIDG